MKTSDTQWYATWFDTPYYHILYKNRDYNEAENFMKRLTSQLELSKDNHILDVACGRGRHAVYLNKIGYKVTGIDLSENSIAFAKQFENETLHFQRHDMCKPFGKEFDAVFNLFTSFGYFEKDKDNVNAIKAMSKNLKPDGIGVIDFLNIHYTLKHIKAFEIKHIDGIEFNINKYVKNNFIYKNISFRANGQDYEFIEKLKCIDLETFKTYLESANLKITETFGDYSLSSFQKNTSDRLILTFRHKS